MDWYDNVADVGVGRSTRFNAPADLTPDKVRRWDPDDPARANKAAAQLEELAEWHDNNGDEQHNTALSRLFDAGALSLFLVD
jgi:hypothetical protein